AGAGAVNGLGAVGTTANNVINTGGSTFQNALTGTKGVYNNMKSGIGKLQDKYNNMSDFQKRLISNSLNSASGNNQQRQTYISPSNVSFQVQPISRRYY
ncbi:TPA: hypothetical protein CPT96_03190, partial [Candidatus Gastranaerophilales bacterium HUM_10]